MPSHSNNFNASKTKTTQTEIVINGSTKSPKMIFIVISIVVVNVTASILTSLLIIFLTSKQESKIQTTTLSDDTFNIIIPILNRNTSPKIQTSNRIEY